MDEEWIFVDSCLDPLTREPAGLSYLRSIGVNAGEAVRLVVVTHWDDDHIQGIAKVVSECVNARVACSLALRRPDILEFVIEQEQARGASGSGLDELRTVLRLCRPEGRLVWALANLPLHPTPPGDTPTAVALSPSQDAVARSIESLIEAATGERVTSRRRYRAPEKPNGASVVASVRRHEDSVLLGGDLVNSTNPKTGWKAVIADARPPTRASVVKVPHHGSGGAYSDGMWTDLAHEAPLAIVTPWALAGGHLPTEGDIDRLRAVAGRLYLVAMPTFRRARKDAVVEKLVTKVAGVRVEELRGWGHVRARRTLGEASWRVDVAGDARAIT